MMLIVWKKNALYVLLYSMKCVLDDNTQLEDGE